PGFGPLAQTGTVVLDGSTTRCSWQIVPGTPTPGIMPASQLPTLVRTDFVQNSNDSAWLSNPAAPLTGFPAIVSRAGIPQNARTRFGLTFLTSELADGRRFTAPELLDVAFSNVAFQAKSLLEDLQQLCATPDASDVQVQCALLSSWDRKADLKSV